MVYGKVYSIGPIVAVAALFVALVATYIVYLRYWCAVRAGSHSVCRRCEYDLRGTPEPYKECPECGADLTTNRSVCIGNRRRHPLAIVISSLIVLVVAAILIGAGGRIANRTNFNPYKPLWLLRIDARDTNSHFKASSAHNEIRYRIAAGKISNSDLKQLFADAIDGIADPNLQWFVPWGDIAWQVIQQDLGTSEQYQQYGEHMIQPTIRARPTVRRGQPIPIELALISKRGFGSKTTFWESHGELDLVVAGHHLPVTMEDFGNLPHGGSLSSAILIPMDTEPFASLPLGSHEVSLNILIQISAGKDGPLIASWNAELITTFNLIESDASPDIRVLRDPSMASFVQDRIEVEYLKLNLAVDGTPLVTYRILFKDSRRDGIAHDVLIDDGQGLWYLGSVSVPGTSRGANGSVARTETMALDARFKASKVDLILSPNIEYAEHTVDIFDILDHEFVIEDIEVVRQP